MDFHCHLDLYPNALDVRNEARRRKCFVWLVTTSPRAFLATSRMMPPDELLTISPGLHPEVAKQKSGELDLLLEQIAMHSTVGEVGIDGSPQHRSTLGLQREIFEAAVEKCASSGGRVLSVHSRFAAEAVLDTLERYPRHGLAVMHWFSGSAKALAKADEMGCWFSVGPTMLQSSNGRKLAASMPRDRLVPESDGPFARLGENPAFPWDSESIAGSLADLWETDKTTACGILRSNEERLLKRIQ
jgi:TatD DNase family protein